MAEITTALGTGTILFAAVAALAITVTGFFLGRRWLAKIG